MPADASCGPLTCMHWAEIHITGYLRRPPTCLKTTTRTMQTSLRTNINTVPHILSAPTQQLARSRSDVTSTMRTGSTSSITGAIITAVATAALISNVSGVWTCPSEREPFCCGKYSNVDEDPMAVIGIECVNAPRNDNCTDGVPVQCCKPMPYASLFFPPRTRSRNHQRIPSHTRIRGRIITAIARLLDMVRVSGSNLELEGREDGFRSKGSKEGL
ncbi:hypothetical protein I7I51_05983 [Histoplasma capsulatum]|uniref:Hydrophobin n=1 Tax=Ajellomyces capsulatus TaxID=5037 RepID=A0A8A1MGN0_AJECA|nr:hypothetical protein I7I51_05983 [Histoplasma capsulatum]